jgi:hypothetical protein
MAKSSDPTKWLERAAHIRGLGRGVQDERMAPMFEKLAARLEAIGIAKAEADLKASEMGQTRGTKGTSEIPAAARAPRRRGKSGGEMNGSTRSLNDEQETPRDPQDQKRTRP